MTTQPSQPMDERLVRLETAVMHAEHQLDELQQALFAQQREIDDLRRALARFQETWEAPELPEIRDPAAEKPPHY